jgi:multiple sugar transport system permease protein
MPPQVVQVAAGARRILPGVTASARRRTRTIGQRERGMFIAFLAPGVLVAIGTIFLPVIYAIHLSFFKAESFISTPIFVGLGNYAQMLSDPLFWIDFANSIAYSIITVALQVVVGVAVAMVLHQEFVGRNLLRGAALAPYILPTVVAAFVWKWLLDASHGLVDAGLLALGLPLVDWFGAYWTAWISIIFVSVWLWAPFVTITFLAGLQTVPDELYEAAELDGAGRWHRFIHITLPVLKPVLMVIVLLRGIFMFSKFDIIWLLTGGGPLQATETLPILAYRKTFATFDVGGGAAVACAMFLFMSGAMSLYFYLFPLDDSQ